MQLYFFVLLARFIYRLFSLKKYIIYIVFTIAGMQALSAQELLMQWTGVVRNDLLQPVPFAHIIRQKDFHAIMSDHTGKFTIIAFPRDTLLVSCVGYKLMKIPVPNVSYDDSRHFNRDIIMEEDTITLSELVIFPWRTYREFKEAFMALELPEDDLQRAYRNIAVLQEQIYAAIANRQATPNSNFRDAMNSRVTRMMTYGHMYPTYSITNPIAWAQFFQALRNGDFKRTDDNNNRQPSVIEEIIQEKTNQ